MVKSVLVLCAHPDDEILGVGGTISRYADEGCSIHVIIFSFGELSHPWMKEKASIEMRSKESKAAGEIVGCAEHLFLGLKEGNFPEDIKEKGVIKHIRKIIRDIKPDKIFCHSESDPHPDHKVVFRTVIEAVGKKNIPIYTFDIWNPINVKERSSPLLYVDITDTFARKIDALKCFKSQKAYIFPLVWAVHWKAWKAGKNMGCGRAEVFSKVR